VRKIRVFAGISYNDGHERCRLDVFRPAGTENAPLVLLVHGGGWSAGHRRQYHQLCVKLAEEGFAAVTTGYRLVPDAAWPDICHDCARGAAYVCNHAGEFGVDASRAVTWGSSAGGHLALMLQACGAHWLEEGVVDRMPEIVGTVAQCPVVFIADDAGQGHQSRLMNGRPQEEVSPYHVPPEWFRSVLVVHGDADETIPPRRSEHFVRRLSKAGVDARLAILAGAPHGYGYNLSGRHARECMDLALPYVRGLLCR